MYNVYFTFVIGVKFFICMFKKFLKYKSLRKKIFFNSTVKISSVIMKKLNNYNFHTKKIKIRIFK